jgi:GT2 family glycosyltransferase
MPKLTVQILNWNGKDLLAQGLPSVLDAVAVMNGDAELLVVDNGSTDGSQEFVRSTYPSVRLLELPSNIGFGEGNNVGVKHANGEIVVLLNNDMTVEIEFLKPLLMCFADDPDLFAVGCQIFFQDRSRRREETGRTSAYWENGTIRYLHQDVEARNATLRRIPITWASGGAAAYSRSKYLELGGFRPIYSPAYVEDTDLSYRAWKRGWHVLFAQDSIVYHKHRASTGKRFDPHELEILVRRNQLFFLWSNISSLRLLTEHLALLAVRLLRSFVQGPPLLDVRAFWRAAPHFIEARALERTERKHARRSDEELLLSSSWKTQFHRPEDRLRVLFVCPYIPCLGVHAGGARMFQLIRGLSQWHDITVLTYLETESERAFVAPLEEVCAKVIPVIRGQSLNEPDWFHVSPHRPIKEFSNPEMKRLLEQEIQSGAYDLVQFEYLEMGHLARLVEKYNVPMILTNHEVQHRNIEQSIERGSLSTSEVLQLRFEWMKMLNYELRVASRFDLVIALTDSDRDALVGYEPKLPVKIHATGVDVGYFSGGPSMAVEPHSMVFVGYYRHFPNADAMEYFCEQVMPRILSEVPDARLYIVGAEPTDAIKKLHDGKSVFVSGRVDDIRPYIARASVYVVPLRLGAGIRGKIMEAWASRKPVVATTLSAAGLKIADGENIMIADDATQFVESILRLFQDSYLRDALGEKGFETCRREYDWSAQVRKHAQLYQELLGKEIQR